MSDHLLNFQDRQEIWSQVKAAIRREYGESTYRSWLRPIEFSEANDERIRLSVPSRFVRDWVQANYLERLRSLWVMHEPTIESIEIIVRPSTQHAVPVPPSKQGAGHLTAPIEAATGGGMNPSPLSAPSYVEHVGASQYRYTVPTDEKQLVKRFSFKDFVVGQPNELAYAAARRVAESSDVAFNPLFLYGGVGLGKTHLMHAIAWHIRETQPERRVAYLSAEKFMSLFIRAVRHRDTMAFKDEFRSVDVLMIDDIHFIGNKESSQEEFFHTFNALVDQNHQVVVSADKSPSDLEGLEDRLKSRLGWGLVADIHPTNYELRLSILQSKAESIALDIPPQVLEFLAHKISSNIRELEGALNRIEAHAILIGRPVTLEMVQDVLHDLLKANDRRVTIEEIQKKVAEHFNIKLSEMYSPRRARSVARPRQIAMYLSKQLTTRSLPEIGRRFGNRDHTTVMHAVRKVEELRSLDAAIDEDVELLRRMLEN
ncbi:MAG: chromosomal replication initiator protein DnaA [Alphaproteobacteria bacterium]